MNPDAERVLKQALPWQEVIWTDWLRQLESKRLPHAMLISGPAGLGKRHLAEAFAQAVLCGSNGGSKPCGQCKSCQLLKAGSHPDFRIVEPEEIGKAIRIAQVRDLVNFLTSTSQQGGWKCVIIEPADAMNSHAANALLKSLEEPPGDTVLILVSSMHRRLMATLRSRCRQIQLRLPPREEALAWLEPRVGKGAEALLDYAHGAPCAALVASENNKLAGRADILASLSSLAQAQATPIDTAKIMQSQPELEAIDQLLAFLNLMAKARLAAPDPSAVVAGPWREIVQRVDSQLLFRYRDKLVQAKSLLLSGANPNKQLLWEELMFDWQALTVARGNIPRGAPRGMTEKLLNKG
jgi:DNA polymerase III subunit delta'